MDERQALWGGAFEWEHPPLLADDEDDEDVKLDERDIEDVKLDERDVEPSTEDVDRSLPAALFADDATDRVVHWYVHDDVRVIVMSNRAIDDRKYREVARSELIETDDGEFQWEMPTALVVGRPTDGALDTVPGDARFEPGEPIHFRASSEMLAGDVRTCYALTDDQLSRLADSASPEEA